MTLLFTLTLTVLLQRNICLFFNLLLLFSLLLYLFYFSYTKCPPYDLVLWTDGSVLFVFCKDCFGVLANCSLCGTEATLFFSVGPVCSSFSAEACAILQALCWSRKHQQICHFSSRLFLSDSRSVLSSIFPFTLISGRNCFLSPPVLSGCNGSPDIRFSRATTRLMSWPDEQRYLFPQQSVGVSLLLSFVSALLFTRTGGTVSHLNSSTARFPRFLPRNLSFYVTLAVFSHAFAATDIFFC